MAFGRMSRLVLFLCTGNYYRSRFAEHLFNHRASQVSLNWCATSRGIATELGGGNIGPISTYVVSGLRALGIELKERDRFPLQLQEQDLAHADLIIAMRRVEPHPFLEARFPDWADRVEYWDIPDLDLLPPGEACARMERAVEALIQRLLEIL